MVSISSILSKSCSFVTNYLGNPGYRLRSLAGKPHLSDNLEKPHLPLHPASLVRHSFSDGGSIENPESSNDLLTLVLGVAEETNL